MHKTISNLIDIQKEIQSNNLDLESKIRIIAVSKTFSKENISPLIEYGHLDFGENKVQEAIDKWSDIKIKNTKLNLHMVGKLQTNKVKLAVKIFDYIHSVDNAKLAKKISDEQLKLNKKIKIFLQVNIGDELQKSGVKKNELLDLFDYCKSINLEVIGLMCIPPINQNTEHYFKEMFELNKSLNLEELSMGMSADFLEATKNRATFLRIGSNIFGKRV